MMKSHYIYILQCSDGSYYIGVTNDVEKRVYEHQHGLITGCYTHSKRPVKVIYAEEFPDIIAAITREKQIKEWPRWNNEVLISGSYDDSVELSNS